MISFLRDPAIRFHLNTGNKLTKEALDNLYLDYKFIKRKEGRLNCKNLRDHYRISDTEMYSILKSEYDKH